MNSFLINSVYMGIAISLAAYGTGVLLHKKFPYPLVNPLLISIAITIIILLVFKVDYTSFNNSAKYLSYLITPATVALAVPLYRNLTLLKKNIKAIRTCMWDIFRSGSYFYFSKAFQAGSSAVCNFASKIYYNSCRYGSV